MSMHEQIEHQSYSNREESAAGEMARKTILRSISSGAGICAKIGETIWKRGTYSNPYTNDVGFVHHILAGKPGTSWNKFYVTLTGINYPIPLPEWKL